MKYHNPNNEQLQTLLSDLVATYSKKDNGPMPTLAEQGLKAHNILQRMCHEAETRGASDIFITTDFPPAIKINGKMVQSTLPPLTAEDAMTIVESSMNANQLQEFREQLEINYAVESKSKTRYRVNAYHEQGRAGMVLRRINTHVPHLDELNLPVKLNELIMHSRGLLILAGSTGCGKSTSMAAMLDHRNENLPGHIITIEDPIEYVHKSKRSIVTQREIGVDTMDWETAIESAMRQAPDVVCVGEVRSQESMEYALRLAQTGHLCVFTIHASSASQAIERIMNFYNEDRHKQVLTDLAMNLVGIIGQRLVVKSDNSGRLPIVDLLVNTPAVQDLVFKGDLMELRSAMMRSLSDGMQTFDQNLFNLYVDGQIAYDEALRQADSANNLRLRIKLYEEGRAADSTFDRVSDLNLMS